MTLPDGAAFGAYVIRSVLAASGGVGTVYLAVHAPTVQAMERRATTIADDCERQHGLRRSSER